MEVRVFVTPHHYCCILFHRIDSLHPAPHPREESTQGHESQEAGLIGNYFRGCLPHILSKAPPSSDSMNTPSLFPRKGLHILCTASTSKTFSQEPTWALTYSSAGVSQHEKCSQIGKSSYPKELDCEKKTLDFLYVGGIPDHRTLLVDQISF